MKKGILLLMTLLLVTACTLAASASSVQVVQYEKPPDTIVIPNNSVPESPVDFEIPLIPKDAPMLPRTGGIPLSVLFGSGLLSLSSGVFLSLKARYGQRD